MPAHLVGSSDKVLPWLTWMDYRKALSGPSRGGRGVDDAYLAPTQGLMTTPDAAHPVDSADWLCCNPLWALS